MENLMPTASGIISLAQRIEEGSAVFYDELAERFAESKESFLTFAKESRKNKVVVVRTYQETITDALEACFSFEGLDLRDYAVHTTLAAGLSYSEALKLALALEDTAIQFYTAVADRSQSLLATIPRALRRVAQRRSKRKIELESLFRATGD